MNMISTLRSRVNATGFTTLTVEEFNQLQTEWITRVVPEGYVLAPEEPTDETALAALKASLGGDKIGMMHGGYMTENTIRSFRVGDLAVVVDEYRFSEWRGETVTIVGIMSTERGENIHVMDSSRNQYDGFKPADFVPHDTTNTA